MTLTADRVSGVTHAAGVPRESAGRRAPVLWLAGVALTFVTIALFSYPQLWLLNLGEGNILLHVVFAEQMLSTGEIFPAHFLYHASVILVHQLTALSWIQAHVVAILGFQVWLALVVWTLVRRSFAVAERASEILLPIAITLGLLLVGPITLLTWSIGNHYGGYIVSHHYYSQTTIALKPLALLAFGAATSVFHPMRPDRSLVSLIKLTTYTVFSTLAKASYSICLLPALGLLVLWRSRLRRFGEIVLLGAGLGIPTAALLCWQYQATYLRTQHAETLGNATIQLSPFLVMGTLSQLAMSGASWAWLAPKFLFSIAFPLCVSTCYWHRARQDPRLSLAWLTFAIGAFFTYFIAEFPNFLVGNFTWSGQITLFVLFVVSALFFIEQGASGGRPLWQAPRRSRRATLCAAVFLLHAGCGIFTFLHPYTS